MRASPKAITGSNDLNQSVRRPGVTQGGAFFFFDDALTMIL